MTTWYCAVLLSLFAVPAVYGQTTMGDMPGMDHGSMGKMPGGSMQGMPMPAPASEPEATGSGVTSESSGAASKKAQSQKRHGAQAALPVVPYRRNPDGTYDIPGTGMAMADNEIHYMVLFDQLEYLRTRDGDGMAWDAQAWVGRDYSKIWFKTEGERINGQTDGRVEVLGSRAVAAFWDAQMGIRHDFGQSPSRQWLAFGIQGIAPYWFDVEAFGYLGPSGRTAARVKADYTVRLSQVVFVTPELEANFYGKSDRERNIGSGLSDVQFGLRLRYEIRREIAPYVGISWGRKFGQTAEFARAAGDSRSERQIVAGVRVWF